MAADQPGRKVSQAPSLRVKDGAHLAAPGHHSPHQNHLLDALPSSDYDRLVSHLELIPMGLGDVLYESGSQLRFVYFPTTSIISFAVRHGGWRVG